MFAVCVAAAINRGKTNLLLQFDQPPSASMVLSRSIAAFGQLQQEQGNFTAFFCNCAMIFDDESSRWVPLERSSQVVHGAQIYLFQPDVPDVAGPIPDPIPAASFLSSYRSPARGGGGNPSQTQYDPSPRGLMPTDPDLSRFNPAERQVPVGVGRNLDFGGGSHSYQQHHYHSQSNTSTSRNVNNNNNGSYQDGNPLSPEQREILRREANRTGSTFVAGGSILKEEREKEDAKIRLALDEHRQRVRTETERFARDVSPGRDDRSGVNNSQH